MDFFTEHILSMILVRLPLKNSTTSKLVCKQWQSILESLYFRKLFMSHHKNSHSSWSLMRRNYKDSPIQAVAHYGCKIWGLPRSLGDYVSSFITAKFVNNKENPKKQKVRVLAYTDVGLILIYVTSSPWNRTYYVANPVTQQCVKIPPLPEYLSSCTQEMLFREAGLVTRTQDGVVLGYKVVLIQIGYKNINCLFTFIIYSSETGLWSFDKHKYSVPLYILAFDDPICLNGDLHWTGINHDGQEVVVSIDFYDADHKHRVIPFPDSDKQPKFKRSFLPSQGNLMYMNIVSADDGVAPVHIWKLKTDEWQLVFKFSPGFINNELDYFRLLMMNPFDGTLIYMWSKIYDSLASINLLNGKSIKVHHNELELSKNGETLSFVGCKRNIDTMGFLSNSYFSVFALPQWLYQIPC